MFKKLIKKLKQKFCIHAKRKVTGSVYCADVWCADCGKWLFEKDYS